MPATGPASLTPTQQRFRLDAATGYLMLGMSEAALRELADFEETSIPPVLRLRGEALREQERHGEALEQFDRLLGVRPSDLSAAIGKAWCLKRLSRIEEAIDTLRAAAPRHPNEALVQYNLACYFALTGDKDRCLSHLGIALRIDPSYVDLMPEEPDFDGLREDADLLDLVARVSGTVKA